MSVSAFVSSVVLSGSGVWDVMVATPVATTALPMAVGMSQTWASLVTSVSGEALYLVGTAVVGIMIFYAAKQLKANQGKIPKNTAFNVSSIMETVWLVVSSVAWYFGEFNSLAKVVAFAYVLYSVFGWLYGFYLLKDQDIKPSDVDDIDNVAMPTKYMDYSQAFAMVIIMVSLVCFGYLYYLGNFSLVG